MKKIIVYLLTFIICIGTNVNAQVTIGSLNSPRAGAVLDLSQIQQELGLLLPNVEITDLKVFKLVAGTEPNFEQVKEDAIGMLVYNTLVNKAKGIEVGLYVWDGIQWNFVSENNIGAMKAKDPLPVFTYSGSLKSGNALIKIDDPSAIEFPGYYTYVVIAGSTYASVTPEGSNDAMFTISFTENNTAIVRKAIVLVTNPAGKSATFVISQEENISLCTNGGSKNPTITPYKLLGNDGVVYLNIDNEPTANYVWTRNNVIVATTPHYIATQSGTYVVHGGSVGCTYKSEITVTLDSSTPAPLPVPSVVAGNNGVLCGSTSVTLYAIGVPSTVINDNIVWFKDGKITTFRTRNPSVNEPGVWFAAVKDPSGNYYSKPSNSVTVASNGTSTPVSLDPSKVKVNNIAIGSFTNFCKGGSLFLTVEDPTPGISYQWYNGNEPITQTSPYVIPAGQNEIFLRLLATDNAGNFCPAEAGSSVQTILLTAPQKPVIQGNNFACLGSTTMLNIDEVGTSYNWYKNGSDLGSFTENYKEVSAGDYRAYYTITNGCKSELSDIKTVELQGAPAIDWYLFSAVAIPNTDQSYDFSVRSSGYFQATGYIWRYDNKTLGAGDPEITPQGVGQSASIKFYATSDGTVDILVKPSNGCGVGSEISKTVKLETGKLPQVRIEPSSIGSYCGGVLFKIMRPADPTESNAWNDYWNSLSASNIKVVNTSNNNVVSGVFSSDGTNYYYFIPKPSISMVVNLTVSGNVGKEITSATSVNITLSNTVLNSTYALKGNRCFNIFEPGLGDTYEYTYELTGAPAGGTETTVVWSYTGTPGIVNSFTQQGKFAKIRFNPTMGNVILTAYVQVDGGSCQHDFYEVRMDIKFQDKSCCQGYLAIGGDYERTATDLPAFESAKYNTLVPTYFYSTGKDLCFYKRDVSPGWVNHSTAEVACNSVGVGIDSGDGDDVWRLPNPAELAAIQTIVTGTGLQNQPTSISGTTNMAVRQSELNTDGNYIQTNTSYWTNQSGTSLAYAYSYVFTATNSFVGTGGTNLFSKSLNQVYRGPDVFRARCVRTVE